MENYVREDVNQSNEKEIKEMAREICGFTHSENKCDCELMTTNKGIQCIAYLICERLHNVGYGKGFHKKL